MRAPTLRVAVFTLLFIAGIFADTSKDGARGSRVRKVQVKRTPVARSGSTLASGAAPAPFSLAGGRPDAEAARATRSAANARWSRLVSDYVSSRSERSSQYPSWSKDIVMVDLPVGGDFEGRPSSVPVLVLPVPFPSRGECNANQDEPERFEFSRKSQRPSRPSRPRPVETYDEPERAPAPVPRRPRPVETYDEPEPAPAPVPRRPRPFETYDEPEPAPAPVPRRPQHSRRPQPFVYQQAPQNVEPPTNFEIKGAVNPGDLIAMFRAQKPTAPQLPPVLIRDRRYDQDADLPPPPTSKAELPLKPPGPGYLPAPGPARGSRAPPPPRFDRSLLVRGEITVYRADYTEPYTVMWDPSGASRMEMHEGTTTSYRMVGSGNRVTRAAVNLDRTGESDVVRCSVMRQSSLSAADGLPPVLPDTKDFTFDGYTEFGNVRVEKWQQTVSGRPGEMGAARGEALVYRHEMLLTRDQKTNFATPIQYSVAVDSSVLGPDCDGYVHRYHEVREQKHDPSLLQIDIDKACQKVEETEDMALVEPLREFTLPARDPRYDDIFSGFIKEFDRKYSSPEEEAVRKNVLTQTTRFLTSGNRLGATFSMATNFLSDRLEGELEVLLGVTFDDEHFPAESFPHARNQLRELADKLPNEFDWRERGGVTPVRYQGSCSSCWAFAVAGAVEGALFRQTRRLVALSEQCLVDCAHPYGGKGCGGTWPSHAYDYVQDRGLPALDEYTPYKAAVQQCQDKRVPPVTAISAHVNVTQFSVPALKVAIRRHAPSVVIIDAMPKSFQSYKTGVFYDDRCNKVKKKLKHAVLAVGWGELKGEAHFILKNSWSDKWGDGGYIRMHGPSNTCGVLTLPSYPRLEKEDVRSEKGDAASGRSSSDDDYD